MAKPKKEQIQQVLDLLKKEGKPIPKNELATRLGLEQRAANVLLAALECMGYVTVGISKRNANNHVEVFGLVRLSGTAPPERDYEIYIPPSDVPARPGGLDFLNCFSRRGNLFVPMRELGRIYATSSVPHDHHLRDKK